MALSDIDRDLLERCIARKARAWEDFVDRFLGLVVHVINHVARAKSLRVSPEDRDDLSAQVLLEIIKDDFALLRHFRRQCSLATYLAVVSRRVVVRELLRRRSIPSDIKNDAAARVHAAAQHPEVQPVERIADREEVQRLLSELNDHEQQAVRLYHLEDKSYREISAAMNIPENSVGSLLSRSREKMRLAAQRAAAAADSH